jgi:hypothetical protein
MPITGILTTVNGAVVILSIQGSGSCQEIDIDWGDGTLGQVGGPLPATAQHTYLRTGAFQIRVTGQKNCQGQTVSTSVVVTKLAGIAASIPDGLRKAFAVVFTECAMPRIESLVPVLSNPTPGGVILLTGCGFGNDDGDGSLAVFLHLNDYTGAQMAPISLNVLGRADNAVVAEIPYDTCGVMDQPATVQVQLGRRVSAPFPIGFRARRVEDYYTSGATIVQCDQTADGNYCITYPGLSWKTTKASFHGFHENYRPSIGFGFSDEAGNDVYELQLLNGWEFDYCVFHRSVEKGELQVDDPYPAISGGSYWQPTIRWWVTPGDTVL